MFLCRLPCTDMAQIRSEFDTWKCSWTANDSRVAGAQLIDSLSKALTSCDVNFFPNINKLLRIFAVIPVTTAEAERSFSMLRYVKNERRSTMTEDRLNHVSLLYVHRELYNSEQKANELINETVKSYDSSHRISK
jgi:hypothetical protein